MFRRRFLLAAVAAASLTLSACSQAVPTKISMTQTQIDQGLQTHFPRQFPVAGLLRLDMQQPALRLLPVSNQLETTLHVQLSGAALPRAYQGQMLLRFGLRYAPQDRSVRAQRVEVLSLELQDAPPMVSDMLQTYGLRLAEQALEDFALYTVPADELALMDGLGLQPGAITVTDQGLDVAIEAKHP